MVTLRYENPKATKISPVRCFGMGEIMRRQKRTRRIAKLLALSLIFSGLPATPTYATEVLEQEETAVPEETAEEEEAAVPEETAEQEETAAQEKSVSVAETNAKIAGSDGVFYDDVLYLSARNVMAMEERLQERYRRLCDEIAAVKNDGVKLENVVFAVDADGDLHCSYSASMGGLDVIQAGMFPDLEEASVLNLETEEADLLPDTAAEQDETSPDAGEDAAENQDEVNPEEREDAAENQDEVNPEEGEDAAENQDEVNSEEGEDASEKQDEVDPEEGEDASENQGEVDPEEGEDAAEDQDEINPEAEEETTKKADGVLNEEAEEEELTVFEENMDKISKAEAKNFDVIEPVRLTDMIDLGYGGFSVGGRQVYSLLPAEDYYRDQLTDIQKKVYDAAKDTLTKGTNQFSVTVQDPSEMEWDDMRHAVSALMLAYPAETDWMKYCPHRLYSMHNEYDSFGMIQKVTVTFDVSDFYSSSLEQQAQEKVKEVGQRAVQYAVENYPEVLTYGVIKYLDQWVCENGYFADEKGGVDAYYRLSEAGEDADPADREAYYNCHTAYGILLKGYGVCESYAKTMSRLLDAVGIPNLFVTGNWKKYGHAWNYVQMPNGKWYLLDSTFNDESGPPSHKVSSRRYLLVKNNGAYLPDGNIMYEREPIKFTFPALADSNYDAGSEYDADSDYGSGNGAITLSQTECSLIPKAKQTLTYTIDGDWDYSGATGVWSSSDTKVAKVDKNGVVTAVAPGTATIFLTASGMAAECKINVDQVKAVKSESTGKTSESVSLGINGEKKEQKTIALTVDMGKSPHTAEWMMQQGKVSEPQTVCSKQNVTVTDWSVSENRIMVTLQAVSQGTASVSVKFAGKTVTIKAASGQLITEEMFDVIWPETVRIEGENRTTPYTGKAVRPVVRKKQDAQYRSVTFKTTYVRNKEAGTASVVVTGSGKYGGTIEYPFIITPLDISGADFSKALKSKAYNGGANPPATVVKLNRKVLKAGRDYEILYNGEKESDIRDRNGGAVPVGSYTITVNGKGNYTGQVSQTQQYTVTTNTIARVSVAGAGSAKYTGIGKNPFTVKIGKNVLPAADYKITWYRGQGKKRNTTPMKNAPTAKGKFTAVITVEGSNLTVTDKKKEIVKNFTIK